MEPYNGHNINVVVSITTSFAFVTHVAPNTQLYQIWPFYKRRHI